MRSAMNAIFYLPRTGCPWRYLPRGVFPPRSTVYNIFRAFQRQGVWEAIWEEPRAALRERLGRSSRGGSKNGNRIGGRSLYAVRESAMGLRLG
jgi:transposase